MRVLDSRFLRGPNVHRMTPCFVSVLDFAGHRPFLRARPAPAAAGSGVDADAAGPALIGAAEAAGLVAQAMSAAQCWAGQTPALGDAASLTPTAGDQFRLVCGYQDEAVAETSLRLAVDWVTALSAGRAFELPARLAALRALARARAGAAQPPTVLHSAPDGHVPVVAVTGTNGKTTTTLLIAHVLRATGVRTGTTTTQGIYIDGQCVKTGDCSGFASARRVLADPTVQVAILETARGGLLKRGLAFDHCDIGVVLNVSSDHLGLDGVHTLQDLAHVKGLIARCAHRAAVLNADDAWCVAMRHTLSPYCQPVFFSLDPRNPVLRDHLRAGGAGACLDDEGWLVWCSGREQTRVVQASALPFTWQGHARYNSANALAAVAALRCMGVQAGVIARSLSTFAGDARSNPMRGNRFDVDGVRLIVDYAHNAAACGALCASARALADPPARLLGVVTSPGDRRPEDLDETGRICGLGFDELVVYEHDPRGRRAGATSEAILGGARRAAPGKPLHAEPRIRHALARGLAAAQPADVLVFTCAGSFTDLVEGVRLHNPAAAERIARELPPHASDVPFAGGADRTSFSSSAARRVA